MCMQLLLLDSLPSEYWRYSEYLSHLLDLYARQRLLNSDLVLDYRALWAPTSPYYRCWCDGHLPIHYVSSYDLLVPG